MKNNSTDHHQVVGLCALAATRTPNLLLRKQALYPIELRGHDEAERFYFIGGLVSRLPCASQR